MQPALPATLVGDTRMTKQLVRPIILAGGNGTRLWPLSRETMPKQLCRLEGDRSLFQKSIERVSDPVHFSKPVIVCNDAHADLIVSQMADLEVEADAVICEPFGRDTAAAILMAIKAVPNNGDKLYLIMPSDHEVGDVEAFVDAVQAASNGSARKRQNCHIWHYAIPSGNRIWICTRRFQECRDWMCRTRSFH